MRRALLISLTLVLALAGWNTAGAADDFYVIPAMRGQYAPVPQTGQTSSSGARDDGALRKGVAWPTPRFTDNNNGTVTDKLTGLIWMKNANAIGAKNWADALATANTLQTGQYGLTDGSQAGDWRLPNLRELQSLLDYGRIPALPANHPFTVQTLNYYWTSTTFAVVPANAWNVFMAEGTAVTAAKTGSDILVWCVRGGP